MIQFPFNYFFVRQMIYTFQWFAQQFKKSEDVQDDGLMLQLHEEFKSKVEIINDFMNINSEVFQTFYSNSFLSFFLIEIYLRLDSSEKDLNPSKCFLLLEWTYLNGGPHIRRLFRDLFARELVSEELFSPTLLSKQKDEQNYLTFPSKRTVQLSDRMIVAQLQQIFNNFYNFQ